MYNYICIYFITYILFNNMFEYVYEITNICLSYYHNNLNTKKLDLEIAYLIYNIMII